MLLKHLGKNDNWYKVTATTIHQLDMGVKSDKKKKFSTSGCFLRLLLGFNKILKC